MSGDSAANAACRGCNQTVEGEAELTLLVENVIYNQETHTNKGEAHEWMPLFVYAHIRVYQ